VRRLLLVVAAVIAFVAVSALVARAIGAGTTARNKVTDLVKLESRGRVRILRLDGVSSFVLGDRTETARVAWKAGTRLPVVQCIRVRRTGDPVSGYRVRILTVSAPIYREAGC